MTHTICWKFTVDWLMQVYIVLHLNTIFWLSGSYFSGYLLVWWFVFYRAEKVYPNYKPLPILPEGKCHLDIDFLGNESCSHITYKHCLSRFVIFFVSVNTKFIIWKNVWCLVLCVFIVYPMFTNSCAMWLMHVRHTHHQ